MRSGLAFSATATTSSTTTGSLSSNSASMSARSTSPATTGLASALGLRPRLAPALAGASTSATALGGRPGFFFTDSSTGAADLAVFLVSSLAEAFSALAGDLMGTGLATFVAGLAAACRGSLLTTFSWALAPDLDEDWSGFRSAGFAEVDGFADF
jgi:hypothetical protein